MNEKANSRLTVIFLKQIFQTISSYFSYLTHQPVGLRAYLPQRGREEFHVGDYEEQQVSPEDKAERAVDDPVTDEVEEDDVGQDD